MKNHSTWKRPVQLLLALVLLVGVLFCGQTHAQAAKKTALNRTKVTIKVGESRKLSLSGKYIYPVSQSASMDRGQFEESVTFIKSCAKGAIVDDGLFTKDNQAIRDYVNGIL